MRPIVNIIILSVFVFKLSGQHKVTFNLVEKSTLKHDSIFLSGTFNNWISEANINFLLKPQGKNKKSITISLPKGKIEYKFHRGSWSKVERSFFGDELPNKIVDISKDTILNDFVDSWIDDFVADKQIAIAHAIHDSILLFNYTALANVYAYYGGFYNLDSATHYVNKAKLIFEKIEVTSKYKATFKNIDLIRQIQEINASIFHALGNYPKSLELRLDNLQKSEKTKNIYVISDALWSIAILYASMKDYKSKHEYGMKMYALLKYMDPEGPNYNYYKYSANYTIASANFKLNKYSEALGYAKSLAEIKVNFIPEWYEIRTNLLLGDIYSGLNNYKLALDYYKIVEKGLNGNQNHFVGLAYNGKAKIYQKINQMDSALINAKKAYAYFSTNILGSMVSGGWGENPTFYISETSPILSEIFYKAGYPDSAYQYLKLYVSVVDTLFSIEKNNNFREQIFNEKSRKQKEEIENYFIKKEFNNKLKLYALLFFIIVFFIVFIMQFKNIKQKQKANSKLEKAYSELKSTQSQLIQSEKMASLGELTAGIAHEIQNPLNFVNNFSEVSNELISELKVESLKVASERDKGLEDELLNDIAQNLEKINHHGKRASDIVKGMLEHSRKSIGEKESTDINALCDEYLRLAFQSTKAKDKDFNATTETHFDPNLPKVDIIPQDIGRVLLNLINNAFYAVNERSKKEEAGYQPTVSITTQLTANTQLLIAVKDNGSGIPDTIKDKIFQPFFTTKPTGQGTGLGLSLSYDIVKAHGGELKVETMPATPAAQAGKEGKGTTFTLSLPVSGN